MMRSTAVRSYVCSCGCQVFAAFPGSISPEKRCEMIREARMAEAVAHAAASDCNRCASDAVRRIEHAGQVLRSIGWGLAHYGAGGAR